MENLLADEINLTNEEKIRALEKAPLSKNMNLWFREAH